MCLVWQALWGHLLLNSYFWFGTRIFILMEYMAVTKLVSGYRGEAKAWHQMADHRLPSHVSIHWNLVVCFWFNNHLCAFFNFYFFFLLQSAAAGGIESNSDAIQPSHIREAIRRYGHKVGPLSPFTVRNNRVEKSYICNLREISSSSGLRKKPWNC